MNVTFYDYQSNLLTKAEKEKVQKYLIDNIGKGKQYAYLFHYINFLKQRYAQGAAGDHYIPFRRLLPYLVKMEREIIKSIYV